MSVIVMQGPGLNQQQVDAVAREWRGMLQARQGYWRLVTNQPVAAASVIAMRDRVRFDINGLPDSFAAADARLFVSDMDSTFITIECVDEIADFAGIKTRVAAITEAAMRGELNFEQSLTQRVALLAGISEDSLDQVYTERLRLNTGGKALLTGLRSRHIKTALVSGGFTFFTERLKTRHHLDFTLANVLEIVDGKLTGRVVGDIVGAEAKAAFLESTCREIGITPRQAIAIGDGANDLPMMAKAGLSIAYHAKPKVQAQALTVINHCGLEGVLGLLDIPVPT